MEGKLYLINRYSCRSFTDEKIKEEELDLIIKAGLNAPSGRNKQDTKLVVIEDENLISKLSKLNARVLNSDTDPFYKAKTIILVFVNRDNGTGVQDASAVMTMMQSEAFILNVGSCWINRLKEMMEFDEGKALLKKWDLENYMGVAVCILGYPKTQGKPKAIKNDRVLRIK